ncbi:MAG: hypothetical protein Q9205_000066 [Flavoplaca limonia]
MALASAAFERSNPAMDKLNVSTAIVEIPQKTIKKITCMGSGFVGGPTSAVIAYKSDVEVTVVDINAERIAAWKSKSLPIYEPGLDEIVQAVSAGVHRSQQHDSHEPNAKSDYVAPVPHGRLFFSTDVDQAVAGADLIFVCVNTPTKTHGIGKGSAADLDFVEAATRSIARVATQDKIVVEKSTVPCRTAQSIREILAANAHSGVRFDVLSNPEFLAEGTAIRDLLNPDRIIIGSMPTPTGYQAAAMLAGIYKQWVPQERIITMNLWSSELSKLAANAMLAQRISSVNALSAICEATGADVDEVSYACGLDSRIGPQMLKAGPGFGGSCFQKDIFNIVYLSESLHLYEIADYWRAVINMNEHQKQRFTKRIISCLYNNLAGKKLAVLGFAFKKNTSDTRESPAITLVSNFVAERARVAIYDPRVQENQIWRELVSNGSDIETLKRNVSVCRTAYEACVAADAVVIMTEWDEFSNKATGGTTVKQEERKPLATINVNSSPSTYTSSQDADHDAYEQLGSPNLVGAASFRVPSRKGTGVIIKDPSSGQIKTFTNQRPFSGSNALLFPHGFSAPVQSPPRQILRPQSRYVSTQQFPGEYLTSEGFPNTRETAQLTDMPHSNGASGRLLTAEVAHKGATPTRLDWARIASGMRKPRFVFDGRNILDHSKLEALGFRVEAIGKRGTNVSE